MTGVTSKGRQRMDKIIAALQSKPMGVVELAEVLGMGKSNVWVYLDKMRNGTPKRVFISGYRKHAEARAGQPAPIYSAGSKPDFEYVPNNRPTPKTSAAQRREQMIALLRKSPMTAQQLGDEMHIVKARALMYVGQMKRENAVYISRWLRPEGAGAWAPVYALGNRPDKPTPKGETSGQRHARLMRNPEHAEEERARRRRRYAVERLRGKPQSIFAALGL